MTSAHQKSGAGNSFAVLPCSRVGGDLLGCLGHRCSTGDVHGVLQDCLVDEVCEGVGVLLCAARLSPGALCVVEVCSCSWAERALEG